MFAGCTTICLAVIVAPSVLPSTSTVLPFVTAPDDAERVPFWYAVEDVSFTVTLWPVDVTSPKPDVDTLLTLPIDPPSAGPDRAFDPRPPGVDAAAAAVPAPVLAAAPATPYAPLPIAIAVAPKAMGLVSLRENMG
jgi:hypothetical protein